MFFHIVNVSVRQKLITLQNFGPNALSKRSFFTVLLQHVEQSNGQPELPELSDSDGDKSLPIF